MKHLIWAFAILSSAAPAAPVTVGFDDLPVMIEKRNSRVQGAGLLKESAQAGQGHLRRSYLPTLSATLGRESYVTGTQDERADTYGGLDARLNLFRGGRDRWRDEMHEARVKSATAAAESTLRGELKRARGEYWQLVSGREMTKILEAALEENRRNLTAAERRIRAGAATETDRIEFEMHQIELEQDLARTRLQSENSQRELAVRLGLDDETEIITSLKVDHDHKDDLLMANYQPSEHPVVSTLAGRAEEAKFRAMELGLWWSPSLDVYAGYDLHPFREREYEPEKERYESVLGVRLTVNLFDGWISRAESQQYRLEAAGLAREAGQTAREVDAQIDNARAALRLTHELIHRSEDGLKRASSYLTRTLDEYRRGVKNSPDVLSASDRNVAMKRRFAELRRDYQLARSELLETLGL